jgi:hypothetical protein
MKLTLELLFDESDAAMIPRNKIETIGRLSHRLFPIA